MSMVEKRRLLVKARSAQNERVFASLKRLSRKIRQSPVIDWVYELTKIVKYCPSRSNPFRLHLRQIHKC